MRPAWASAVVALIGCAVGCGDNPKCPAFRGPVQPMPAGPAPIVCEGTALNMSTTLDLNARAISVTGRVTLNGAALPNEKFGRGQLVFSAAGDPQAITSVNLESTGAVSYALRLTPGIYQVDYRGFPPPYPEDRASYCFPFAGGRLLSNVDLTTDSVLDIDIPVIELRGAITAEGQALGTEFDSKRGSVGFTPVGGDTGATLPLQGTGPASYVARLMPRTYDVTYQGRSDACANISTVDALPSLPCNTGVVKRAVSLDDSGVLDIDIPVVHVSGDVTIDGQEPPREMGSRGELRFVSSATLDAADPAYASTGYFEVSGAVKYAL